MYYLYYSFINPLKFFSTSFLGTITWWSQPVHLSLKSIPTRRISQEFAPHGWAFFSLTICPTLNTIFTTSYYILNLFLNIFSILDTKTLWLSILSLLMLSLYNSLYYQLHKIQKAETFKFQLFVSSAQSWNRTSDTRIFSPLLYQLSYLGLHKNSGDRIWTYDLRVMSPTSFQTAPPRGKKIKWAEMDSNHRSITQQIYSLSPLATRESTHFLLFGNFLL